jgi:thiol-disulfide isomerase/thioredoxin
LKICQFKIMKAYLLLIFSLILFSAMGKEYENTGFCIRFISDHPSLPIGSPAPPFSLPATDGKTYSLASFSKADILVIVFTCNHCPTAQAYEDRIIQLTKDFKEKNVAVIAIMPNDPISINLDELGYTDMGDSFEEMKLRAKEKKFNFPYLYDGENEKVSLAYGPVATPHVFIFDKYRILRYSGRIDDMEKPTGAPTQMDARNAINLLLGGKPVSVSSTKVFGCSIKWAEKSTWIEKSRAAWAKEPVSLDTISEAGIRDLVQNHSDKVRLINVWATWCGPCASEFPEFITINRMYRKRDFEFTSISADEIAKQSKTLQFLQKQESSSKNYIYSGDNKYKLIEAIDPKWPGALPYTLLIEPGGKIVFAKEGIIDPAELKKAIVEDPFIGRYY